MIVNPYAYASGAADPYFSSVVALLHCDGANGSATITDVKGHAFTPTGCLIDTSQSVFGGASLANSGSASNRVDSATSSDFTLGSGDWTIEFWHRVTSVSLARGVLDYRPASTNGLYPTIYQNGADLIFFTNSAARITASGALTVNTWRHIAVSKNSGTTRMFIGGTQAGSSYADANTYVGDRIRLMNFGDSLSGSLVGFLDDVRVTKGVGRYTANFTPPTAAFPNS